jgi:hypothetical protein
MTIFALLYLTTVPIMATFWDGWRAGPIELGKNALGLIVAFFVIAMLSPFVLLIAKSS